MRLPPRATLYFVLQKLLLWIVLSLWLGSLFGGWFSHAPGAARAATDWILPMGVFLAAILAIDTLVAWLRARSYAVELTEQGVTLDYGVLSRYHETLLFAKVQDIVITRNVLQRLLGLSTVVIQNAMGQPQKIPALGAGEALALRDAILKRASR